MTTFVLTGKVLYFYAESSGFSGRAYAPQKRHWLLFCARQLRVRICSALNRPFKEWEEVFPNAACVVSLIDRLVHRYEFVAMQGESYRLKEAKDRAA